MTTAPHKLITGILSRGRGIPLLEALRRERAILSASVHHARGIGRSAPRGRRALRMVVERDVVQILVSAFDADDVFEYLGREGGVGEPHGGLLYMRTLRRATSLTLPDLPDES